MGHDNEVREVSRHSFRRRRDAVRQSVRSDPIGHGRALAAAAHRESGRFPGWARLGGRMPLPPESTPSTPPPIRMSGGSLLLRLHGGRSPAMPSSSEASSSGRWRSRSSRLTIAGLNVFLARSFRRLRQAEEERASAPKSRKTRRTRTFEEVLGPTFPLAGTADAPDAAGRAPP